MQQLHTEPEKETRYDLETVKRAATLAVKLQESRRETLSQAEVDAMAAEAGIDPVCMRQALQAVRKEQAQMGVAQLSRPRRATTAYVAVATGIALSVALLIPGLYLARVAPEATPATASPLPPVATESTIPPTPASAQGLLLKNGTLTASATVSNGSVLPAGSTAVPGWRIISGQARYLRLPGSTGGALSLGPNTWLEQLVPTVPGASYRLTYEVAGEAGPEARLHRMTVKAIQPNHAETSQEASVFTESGRSGPTGWVERQMDFQAQDVAVRIDFGSSQPSDGTSIPVVRNIRVERTSNLPSP